MVQRFVLGSYRLDRNPLGLNRLYPFHEIGSVILIIGGIQLLSLIHIYHDDRQLPPRLHHGGAGREDVLALGLHQDVCFGFRLRAGIDLASFPIVLVVLDKDPCKADTENTELPVDRGRNRLTSYLWQYSRYRANGSRVE